MQEWHAEGSFTQAQTFDTAVVKGDHDQLSQEAGKSRQGQGENAKPISTALMRRRVEGKSTRAMATGSGGHCFMHVEI
jgi:hypothetical protein